MKLTRSTLQIVIDGRSVTAGGEAYLPGHGSPDFVVYKDTIKCWDDGQLIDVEAREEIVRRILAEGGREHIRIEVE